MAGRNKRTGRTKGGERDKRKYYVRATTGTADELIRILKHGETFAVLSRFGDVDGTGFGQMGVFYRETRHLSRLAVHLDDASPLLLSSIIHEDNAFLSVDMTNLDMTLNGGEKLQRETIHVYRSKFVLENTCYDEIRIMNYGPKAVRFGLTFSFDSDFADIFEIRGAARKRRGKRLEDTVESAKVVLSYKGLDSIVRYTALGFFPAPTQIGAAHARYELELEPKQQKALYVDVSCAQEQEPRRVCSFQDGYRRIVEQAHSSKVERCRVTSSNSGYSAWFSRSIDDLHLLTVGNPEGPYPYAGVPWFNTVFGRDGIITAIETLWMTPSIANAVLRQLSAMQATKRDDERDAQPGKILHEMRRGEMANTREVPFGCYYGSVDSTPLFVILAGAYLLRTGDIDFLIDIWPNIQAALRWIDDYGDVDGDDFVEYCRQSDEGLVQQGWKDSNDSIFHADGQLAKAPIALCEVQAYAYAAKRLGAGLARKLGDAKLANGLDTGAEELRGRFEQAFWNERAGTYALALDGEKKQCAVRSSNAGQALFCRIASMERARRVRDALMADCMFSGWGVRTISAKEVRYNPMSYHNGSIWPHDNALIALGLSVYGMQEDAARILKGMKDASQFFDLTRMPELFCGFHKRGDSTGPTMYPVACSPQAWSAGASLLLLRSALGLTVRAEKPQIRFVNPRLPSDVDEVCIENLRVGNGVADVVVRRRDGNVDIHAIRKEGDIQILKAIA